MRRRVLALARSAQLVRPGQRVLVACSGGVDSMALTAVLAELASTLGIDLGVCSIDHGLRPEASEEVETARAFARQRGLPFFARRVSVALDDSLQAAARKARYEALFEVAAEQGFDLIATGHTRDDQAETVLARIFRSGSIAGLSAIAVKREDGVIRPILTCSREMVLQYVNKRGIEFCEDPTNRDLRFERVRMRSILATLRKEETFIDQRLAELATHAREHRAAIARWGARVSVASTEFSRARILELPAAVAKEVLARWALAHCRKSLGSQMQQQAYGLIQLGKGELWLSDDTALTVDSASIRLVPRLPA